MRFDHVKVVDVMEQDSRSASVFSEGSGRYFEVKTEHHGGITTKVLLENQKTGKQRTWSLSDTHLSLWPGHELVMAYDDQGLVMFYNKSTVEIVRMRGEAGYQGDLTGQIVLCALLTVVCVFLPIFGLLSLFAINKKSGNGPTVDRLNKNISIYMLAVSSLLVYFYYHNGLSAGFHMSVVTVIPVAIGALVIGFMSAKGGNTYIQNIENELMKEVNSGN